MTQVTLHTGSTFYTFQCKYLQLIYKRSVLEMLNLNVLILYYSFTHITG